MQNPEIFEPEVNLTNQEAKEKLDKIINDLVAVKADTEKLKEDTTVIKEDIKKIKEPTV